MRKLIVGCGYLGSRVARRWLAAGHEVWGVVREPRRAAELAELGIRTLAADVTRPATLAGLPDAETVLYSVGYRRGSAASRWDLYVGGLENVLRALPSDVGRMLYISSTGVYGQEDAAWVDEQTACCPQREAGRAFCAAEQRLAAHPLGTRSVVLRMAGLYGPGRVPHLAELRAGQVLAVPSEGFLNLIHVDDMVEVLLAAEGRAAVPSLYLASDGQPILRRDYYAYLAELLGVPCPPLVAPPPDAPVALRAGANKRVSSRRLVADLGVTFQYPTCREGLRASLRDSI